MSKTFLNIAVSLLLTFFLSGCRTGHSEDTVTLYGADGKVIRKWEKVICYPSRHGFEIYNQHHALITTVTGNVVYEPKWIWDEPY